ncbi:GNAT family N-acetyltransferase [Methylobacterium sp. R2-1]|uniref:GNAT family N-acetyltransferase n=1 Tax=Methylobacterium sp. R2-1 TaxID=2587064 RepID=UPI001618965C|nr:GNAT family N-acetyltransferase [Methylobacterium sp. R2-1]MBB2959932.1 putative acetyltransferase [Methylobacterium sp. R2-1]
MDGTEREVPLAGRVAVRPYSPADLDAVIGIYHSAIRETAAADYMPAQIEAWSQVDRVTWAAGRQAGCCWVAWIDGEAAGFADLEPCGHLDMLYVRPAHGRQGVARALIQAVEATATAHGVSTLQTEASLTARPFFEAAGFRVVVEETVKRNGQSFRRYRMRKDGF